MAVFTQGLLVATVRLSTPLLLAATGELIAEESGVLNLGVEGMMLTGALSGFLATYFTGSLWMGWLAAVAAGAGLALVFGYFTITLRCHQVIVALGINLLASGGTAFCYRTLFGLAASTPKVATAEPIPIPGLASIPWLGPILFHHDLLVYLAFAAPWIASLVLYHTSWGAIIRSVGDNPRAAESVGVPVLRVRYLATAAGGAMAGLGGSYFTTVDLNVFIENMTGGAGWIAVAIVIFGNWRPLGVLGAALFFGAAEALQLRLQIAGTGIPRELIVMLPYVLTLVALCGKIRRSNAPSKLCIPYVRIGAPR
jgi:simple sugar transport system permease protein